MNSNYLINTISLDNFLAYYNNDNNIIYSNFYLREYIYYYFFTTIRKIKECDYKKSH